MAMQEDRIWRRDQGAILGGVCAGLAEDLDLPLPLIRLVGVLFLVLPTGLAYLALSMLLRRRPARARSRFASTPDRSQRTVPNGQGGPAAAAPTQNWALLAHRFETLEPRLKRIEAFVTSKDFELHRDFRRMDEQSAARRMGQ